MHPIFVTVYGSHAWGMDNDGSDVDIFVCEAARTHDILAGERFPSVCEHKTHFDKTVHELGHVVAELATMNINYLVGLFSPEVIVSTGYHTSLMEIVRMNPSLELYNSVRGLAISNLKKYDAPRLTNSIFNLLCAGCRCCDFREFTTKIATNSNNRSTVRDFNSYSNRYGDSSTFHY